MKTMIVAVTCLFLGASLTALQSRADELMDVLKPERIGSVAEIEAELRTAMRGADMDTLWRFAAASERKGRRLSIMNAKYKEAQDTFLDKIATLRNDLSVCRAE